jgi:hypothetical protein
VRHDISTSDRPSRQAGRQAGRAGQAGQTDKQAVRQAASNARLQWHDASEYQLVIVGIHIRGKVSQSFELELVINSST